MGSPATLKDISGTRDDWRAGVSVVEGQDRGGVWQLVRFFFKSGRMALIGQVLPPFLLDFQAAGHNVGTCPTACRGLLGVRLVEDASTLCERALGWQ